VNLEDLKDAANTPIVPTIIPTLPSEFPVILPGPPPSVAHGPEVSDSEEDIMARYVPNHFSKSCAHPTAEQLKTDSAAQETQELGWEIVAVEEAPVMEENGQGANRRHCRQAELARMASSWTRGLTRWW
jgi:hypothetical protein